MHIVIGLPDKTFYPGTMIIWRRQLSRMEEKMRDDGDAAHHGLEADDG
ncbi:MAG: hypothetical protein ACP5FL_05705 [Thermoplasmatota archaeon]